MSRQRYQRGTLRSSVPARKGRPERRLPRGTYWARWYRYVRQPDGTERRSPREKIITKELARKFQIGDGEGPLGRADAQRVLDVLIAQDTGVYTPPDTAATFESVAREFIALNCANWGPHTYRTSTNLIETHLIKKLGKLPVADIGTLDLQQFLNRYVEAAASQSLLNKLLLYLRSIFDVAVVREIIQANPAKNPAYRLRAKSRKQKSQRSLSIEECRRLLGAVVGRDHLIIRLFIQCGLRPEELFALRRDDVQGEYLRIDETIVEGVPAPCKSDASDGWQYLPPDLQAEMQTWLGATEGDSRSWLFPSARQGRPWDHGNYLNRVLKPAGVRARIGITERANRKGEAVESSDVNFQVLRRTSATLFGDRAKDPKSTQAHLRHADPATSLRHYQQAIPASIKAASIALEMDLLRAGGPDQNGAPN